jgi:hypothetical protein
MEQKLDRKHYVHRYKYGKQTRRLTIDQLSSLMLKIKKDRTENFYLGVDPLRDSSLLAVYYWSGLRLAEVVGDRKRNYKVSRFSKEEREDMRRKGIDWHDQPDPYIIRTSPERPGIRKEDIEFNKERNVLEITALALKHGKRDAPLELSLLLPFVDLIKEQWELTKPGEKIWDLKREYAWEILKELDPKLYTHYYRLNRAMEFVKVSSTSPAHLLSWFGWRRLQTAYNYLALGGRRIEEMSASMVQQYTGKKVEVPPEKVVVEEELKEEPIVEPKPPPRTVGKKLTDKEYQKLLKEVLGRDVT